MSNLLSEIALAVSGGLMFGITWDYQVVQATDKRFIVWAGTAKHLDLSGSVVRQTDATTMKE